MFNKIKCIIVEDEPIAQRGLQEYIEQIDFLELVGITDNFEDAFKIIKKENIQLQLINADFPDLQYFNQVNEFKKIQTIVISGYHQSSFIAKNDKINYLHKPFSFFDFHKTCLEKFEKLTLNPEHKKYYENGISSRN